MNYILDAEIANPRNIYPRLPEFGYMKLWDTYVYTVIRYGFR